MEHSVCGLAWLLQRQTLIYKLMGIRSPGGRSGLYHPGGMKTWLLAQDDLMGCAACMLKAPVLGLMIHCCCLEILNNF